MRRVALMVADGVTRESLLKDPESVAENSEIEVSLLRIHELLLEVRQKGLQLSRDLRVTDNAASSLAIQRSPNILVGKRGGFYELRISKNGSFYRKYY